MADLHLIAARRIYHDANGLVYNVTLFRSLKPPSNAREKYQLSVSKNWFVEASYEEIINWWGQVFETIAEPHVYSTYIKSSRPGKSTVDLLTTPKSTLESAVAKFRSFFKQETGKEWEDKDDGLVPPPKVGPDGGSLPVYEGWFSLEEKRSLLSEFLRSIPKGVCYTTDNQPGYEGELASANGNMAMQG